MYFLLFSTIISVTALILHKSWLNMVYFFNTSSFCFIRPITQVSHELCFLCLHDFFFFFKNRKKFCCFHSFKSCVVGCFVCVPCGTDSCLTTSSVFKARELMIHIPYFTVTEEVSFLIDFS